MSSIVNKIIISLVLIGVVIAGLLYREQIIGLFAPAPEETPTVEGRAVYENTLSFLANSIKNDGTFVTRYRCENGACEEFIAGETMPVGYIVPVLLAETEASADTTLRAKLDTVMERILTNCEQNSEVCANNFPALDAYYELTDDERYRDAMIRADAHLMTLLETEPIIEILTLYGTYRKLETLYGLTGDEEYRDALIAAADEKLIGWPNSLNSLQLYESSLYPVYYHSTFVINGLFLPAYRLTGDVKYLDPAREFLALAAVNENTAAFRPIGEVGMAAALNAIEAYAELATLEVVPEIEKSAAEVEIESLLSQTISWQYDAPGRVTADGTYGFVTGFPYGVTEEEMFLDYKSVNSAAAVIQILSERDTMLDYTFPLFAF